jgi:hypothetical protein
MRDLPERDEIREKYAGRPGISGQVEHLMGERENAEAYGQDELAGQLDEQLLAGFGYVPAAARARKAAAEKQAAEAGKGEEIAKAARKQAPAERKAPADKQSAGG